MFVRLMILLGATLWGSAAAFGQQTLTVASLADSGPGSLRQRIVDANTSPGSTIEFLLPPNSTILLASPLRNITANMTIDGSAVSGLNVSGSNQHQVFFVESGNVSISNGLNKVQRAGGDGGGSFAVQGLDLGRDWALVGGGGGWQLGSGWSLLTNCDARVNTQQVFHVASGNIQYLW